MKYKGHGLNELSQVELLNGIKEYIIKLRIAECRYKNSYYEYIQEQLIKNRDVRLFEDEPKELDELDSEVFFRKNCILKMLLYVDDRDTRLIILNNLSKITLAEIDNLINKLYC